MRKLLNTLFITTENAYASLDGENIVISVDKKEIARFPLHNFEGIISFSYSGASPSLLGACALRDINFVFCKPSGRFLCRVTGETRGNVLLRREQYRIADHEQRSCAIARNIILGKIANSKVCIDRMKRDHALRIDVEKFSQSSQRLQHTLSMVRNVETLDTLRGIEGVAANEYFGLLDSMILGDKGTFYFKSRNRRPPMDPLNATLSFIYTILANDCASALEAVGLDAYVGFMHQDRPGRKSLALDLMEELRPCLADRFVITAINNRVLTSSDFLYLENGTVAFTDEGRRKILRKWQERKTVDVTHPYLKEKIKWGQVPYVQALLLARHIRQDLDEYPPFLWR